jgi:subtilisin family serine protease
MKQKIIFLALVLSLFLTLSAQEDSQAFLSLKQTGVDEFLKNNPEYDGRGTIIFVLDTGVDFGIEGLLRTTTGETKVIDVQDFTGQGDIEYYEADMDEEDGNQFFVNEDMNLSVSGADKLGYKAVDDEYYIGGLPESMWMNSSSGAGDVNGNGQYDDTFVFVCFNTNMGDENFWVVYIDSDNDGDLSDEKPLMDYKVNYDHFSIPNDIGLPNFTFGINIFPDRNTVTFHFDDGAHGTHCAGIAAGYKIGSIDLNGVAPGASLVSLKLGNNNYSGGATVSESMKKCYLYADSISKATEIPCIINMSFGVGSEIEGKSDMALFLEDLTTKNPYLYISTSNGNEGPGISTSGLPAASTSIFSSGAVLTQEAGANLYSAQLERDVILYFSSRGGEVQKPDVIAPGAMTSTVPAWETRDRYWGTSMASPYSAGVMALLLSAAKAEFPDVKIPSQLLYKVLRESAAFQEDYDHVDQGGGYLNVPAAYELLKTYLQNNETAKLETYTVSAMAPNMPGGSAQNLYIRDGSFLTGNSSISYLINRKNTVESNKFYRAYKLESDQEWLMPIQKKVYIRNDQSATVTVKLDETILSEPGLYNGKIKAYRADASNFPEFDLMATVVIPYEFNSSNNYKQGWDGKLAPGMFERYFIKIPAGATSMKVMLSSDKEAYTSSRFMLHDPNGRELFVSGLLASDKESKTIEESFFDITAGVYELVVTGFFRAKNTSSYSLKIEFNSITALSETGLNQVDNTIKVVNQFNRSRNYSVSGEISGYMKKFDVDLDKNDRYEYPFTLYSNEKMKSFHIELSKDDFNKTTDFAMLIYDTDGKVQSTDALSYKSGSVEIVNSFQQDSVNLKLVLLPAFSNEPSTMRINVKEKTEFENKKNFSVSKNGATNFTMYPSIVYELNCQFEKPDEKMPPDAVPYGKISFRSTSSKKIEYELPVYFNF